MRILLVEDHEAFAAVVTEQFLSGHDVVHVRTVAEGVALDPTAFDLALVDFDLPDGKGAAVVQALRARRTDLKIVATSSHQPGNDALRRAGADAVCAKADFAELPALLERLSAG